MNKKDKEIFEQGRQESEQEIKDKIIKIIDELTKSEWKRLQSIQEQEGKKAFEYDIYECPEELKGQLKIGDFYG